MKKVVFIDMDGVLADFEGALADRNVNDPPEMYVPGFYTKLAVMPGAHYAVHALLTMKHLDVHIGTKMSTGNLLCASEKMQWIAVNFPKLLKKTHVVCDKSILRGDVLIDDDKEQWEHKFKGQFIHFDKHNPAECWKAVVEMLK